MAANDRPHPTLRASAIVQIQLIGRSIVIFGSAIVFGMIGVLSGNFGSSVAWLGLLAVLSLLYHRSPREHAIAQVSFVFISLVGMIIIRDNLANFQTPFSGGHDDSEFFYAIIARLEGNPSFFEVSAFQYFNLAYGYVVSILTFRDPADLALYDILPLGWAAVAVCAVHLDRIIHHVTGRTAPLWVVLVPILANHNFVGNVSRFYRDVYVVLFIVLIVDLALSRRHLLALGATAGLALLRGGNALIMLLFLATAYRINEGRLFHVKRHYALILGTLAVVYFGGLRERGNVIYAMTSRVANAGAYINTFRGENYEEIIQRRILNKARNSGNLQRWRIIEGGGLMGAGYKAAYSVFFPITFYGPYMAQGEFHAPDASSTYTARGFFLYNVVKWLYVVAWVLVVPYLVIGVYAGLSQNKHLVNIICIYLLTVLALSQISFQIRHTVAFVVLHPILVAIGYDATKGRLVVVRQVLALTMAVVIVGYNMYKFG